MGGMGAAFGAASAQGAASASWRGDTFQAQQEGNQYFQGMLKSYQTDTAMTNHLSSTISNIEAVRASSGASINSPSGNAIQTRVLDQGNQDIARETDNIQQQALQHLLAMGQYQQGAEEAVKAGNMGAIGSILGGMGGITKMFGG